jgi:hypothetical protein
MRPRLLDRWQLAAVLSLTGVGCGVRTAAVAPSQIGRSDAPALASVAPARRAEPASAVTPDASPQTGLPLPSWARRLPPAEPGATGAESIDGKASEAEGEGAPSEELDEAGGPEGRLPDDDTEGGEGRGALAP